MGKKKGKEQRIIVKIMSIALVSHMLDYPNFI